MSDEDSYTDPKQIVDTVESECQNPLGPNIRKVLTALVRLLDQRYKNE